MLKLETLATVGSTALLRRTENGREHAVVSRPAAVAIVAIRPGAGPGYHHVLLVDQYRPAVRSVVTEIPAGKIDGDELPEHAAERELAEEAGLRAARWDWLVSGLLPSPGYSAEEIDVFIAQDFTETPRRAEDAHIQRRWTDLDDTLGDISRGKDLGITDAKTVTGLLLARAYLRGDYIGA